MGSSDFFKMLQGKKGLIFLVYLTLLLQLAITFSVIYINPKASPSTTEMIVCAISIFVLVIAIILIKNTTVKFILFLVFSMVTGFFLKAVTSHRHITNVNRVLISAIGVFVVFSVVGVILSYMGINLGWMGIILLCLLLASIVWSMVVFIFFDPKETSQTYKWVMWFGIIVFSLYVVYDTNRLLIGRKTDEDFVDHSLGFYLDFINIFTKILSLSNN
jgi:FtsH-binding integral membrane protein